MSKQRTWMIGTIAAMVAVLVGVYMLGISPILTQISTANSQTATITATNAASQAQLASLKTQFASIGKLKTKLNGLRGSIPEAEGTSTFFNELTALSAAYGVTVTSLTLADATIYVDPAAAASAAAGTTTQTPAPSATPATATVTTPVTTAAGLVLVPVNLSVTGAYAAVQGFIGAVQTGTRLVYVTAMTIDGLSDGSTSAQLTGDMFTLQGTSDVVTKPKLVPTPTATATPTATPTPTPTATKAAAKSGSSTAPTTAPTTPPVTPSPTDTPAGP
jgi:Tfp pilus assembly protein PilO